jgi:hypothetical protein
MEMAGVEGRPKSLQQRPEVRLRAAFADSRVSIVQIGGRWGGEM